MKNKTIAILLTILFGVMGIHRFYLGEIPMGISYFLGTIISLFFIIIGIGIFGFIIIAFALGIDIILLALMNKYEFDRRYNKKDVSFSH